MMYAIEEVNGLNIIAVVVVVVVVVKPKAHTALKPQVRWGSRMLSDVGLPEPSGYCAGHTAVRLTRPRENSQHGPPDDGSGGQPRPVENAPPPPPEEAATPQSKKKKVKLP